MNKFIFSKQEIEFFKSALFGKIKELVASDLYHKLSDNCAIFLSKEEIICLKDVIECEHKKRLEGRKFEAENSVITPKRKAAITTANFLELAAISKLNNVQLSIF